VVSLLPEPEAIAENDLPAGAAVLGLHLEVAGLAVVATVLVAIHLHSALDQSSRQPTRLLQLDRALDAGEAFLVVLGAIDNQLDIWWQVEI
jgi:hypothetical protein